MYLIPRLIGIGIYTIILIFLALVAARSKKDARRALTIYWIALGVMAYFFVPPSGFDLPRLIVRMNGYASLSWKNLLQSMTTTLVPGERLYYWILGHFQNSDKLLPCISGLISFGFCFGVLKDHTKKEHTGKELAIALVLFMSRGAFVMAIDTIRSFMATAIITWCVYEELVNSKSVIKHLPLYILACSMHAVGYVYVALRFGFWIIDREKNTIRKLYRIAAGVLISAVSVIVLSDQLQMLLRKATVYYNEGQAGTSYSYFWEGLLSALTIVVAIYLLRRVHVLKKNAQCIPEQGYEALCRFTLLVLVVDIITFFVEFNFYMRTGVFLTVLIIPLTLYCLKLGRQSGKQTKDVNMILFFSAIIFMIAASRGYLCSLKFFVL